MIIKGVMKNAVNSFEPPKYWVATQYEYAMSMYSNCFCASSLHTKVMPCIMSAQTKKY